MAKPHPRIGFALAFDDFGWGELSDEARGSGCSVGQLVHIAIVEYLDALETDTLGRTSRVPRFAREREGGREPRIEIELTDDEAERLQDEAAKQQVSVPLLVDHAVFLRLGRDRPPGSAPPLA